MRLGNRHYYSFSHNGTSMEVVAYAWHRRRAGFWSDESPACHERRSIIEWTIASHFAHLVFTMMVLSIIYISSHKRRSIIEWTTCIVSHFAHLAFTKRNKRPALRLQCGKIIVGGTYQIPVLVPGFRGLTTIGSKSINYDNLLQLRGLTRESVTVILFQRKLG